ncbi:MAG TPA: hypothetical protein PKC03_06450 [Dokdonella sp.]|jgi:hypothetical protein|nr:hypothetical protein [Dokdonella sp.]
MRFILATFLALLLGACGGAGRAQMAADACVAEANQRLSGKSYEIDSEKLVASAKDVPNVADTLQVSGPVIFDRGLGTEYTQMLNCKVRIDGKSASVIAIEFIWSMKDLKMGG